MNIFATDVDPVKAAQSLDDRRMVKMIVESCQMLSMAVRSNVENCDSALYGFTHRNHPCSIWTRESSENFRWLLRYTKALLKRYTKQYGKEHKSAALIPILEKYKNALPKLGLTPFANCARSPERGLDFTHLPVHEAYQQYLAAKWRTDKLVAKKNRKVIFPQPDSI